MQNQTVVYRWLIIFIGMKEKQVIIRALAGISLLMPPGISDGMDGTRAVAGIKVKNRCSVAKVPIIHWLGTALHPSF